MASDATEHLALQSQRRDDVVERVVVVERVYGCHLALVDGVFDGVFGAVHVLHLDGDVLAAVGVAAQEHAPEGPLAEFARFRRETHRLANPRGVILQTQLLDLQALHLRRHNVCALVGALELVQNLADVLALALERGQRGFQAARHVLRLGALHAAEAHDRAPVVAHLLPPTPRAARAHEHGASLGFLPQRPAAPAVLGPGEAPIRW